MASTSSASTPSSSISSDHFTPTEWTRQTMFSDVMQQKALLIGAGVMVGLCVLFMMGRRPAPQEEAARRLVRNWRKVDDADDVRDLLGSNLPAIVRPALLMVLHEIERQVHKAFESIERDIERL
jgi:hypothetical protein